MPDEYQHLRESADAAERKPCGACEGDCVCHLAEGHANPHACGDPACGGQWSWDGDRFVIVRIPGDPDGSQTAALRELLA